MEKKCSIKKHENVNANIFCQECKIYMCNTCESHHSELFQNHHQYKLDKDKESIYTGICKEENHSNKLEYYCYDHNELCCSSCISKIKGKGNGQHMDCNVCFIESIKEEKKNNLEKNMEYLEEFSKKIKESITQLKNIFEKISKDKEELKLNIQKIFTKIRNKINVREDELLLEVDKQFEHLYFSEELIKKSEKIPKKNRNIFKNREKSKYRME